MYGYSTTHHPNGITNAVLGSTLQTYGALDPFVIHAYSSDFDTFNSSTTTGDWKLTATTSGSVTNSVVAGDGGWLALVNTASSADLNSIQLQAATFAIVAGNEAWFKCRFKVSSATNANLIIGLIQTTVTPLTVTDGLYFSKVAASTQLTCKATASSASTTFNVGTMADNTFLNVGWHFDGSSTINVYLNNSRVGSMATTNLPTAALNLTIAESNGTGAAITTTVDYILAATQRPSTAL